VGEHAAYILRERARTEMKSVSKQSSLVAAILFTLSFCAQSLAGSADLLLIHGRIYTLDSAHPEAQAVAVGGAKILAVGSEGEIARYRGPSTKVLDAKGRLVLPGFTDCHVHFLDASLALGQLSLDDAKTVSDVQQRVKTYAAAHPSSAWLLGRGWSYPLFPSGRLPDKKYLDEVVPDRAVYLESGDGHSWWANSKALEAAGIRKDTPDPPGGEIVRNPGTGEPTGAIKEDAADALVRRAIPEPTRKDKLEALRAGIKLANQFGLTRVHVLGSVNAGHDDLHIVDLYEELRRTGELTLRFYLAYRVDPPEVSARQIEEIVEARDRYHDDWIAAGSVKFFMDGVVETHTAAMLEPYSDDPRTSGQLLWDAGRYRQAVAELDRRRIQVFTHAIGDRAIRVALDAYESAAKGNGTNDARHRVEHVEVVSAQDIPRFGSLGVIASMQPLHAYPDDDALHVWAPNVGSERRQRAWAWRSIARSGGVVAFGSDWPIVTLNPWPGVESAVTRQTDKGEPKGGWMPSERLSLADTIRAYTSSAAFAGHRERSEGSIQAGKLADLIVISQDVFQIDPLRIGQTKVLLTIVGGQVVYQSESF
jgi:predicted amidohydrolase YtcJ